MIKLSQLKVTFEYQIKRTNKIKEMNKIKEAKRKSKLVKK
jgi:hypothetical protein